MKYKLKVYNIWEYGQRKDSQGNPHQEDNMFPEAGKQSDEDRLFILCDGMGGHDAGEVASATVCEAMSKSILNDGHDKEGIFTPEEFTNALNAAFDALDKKDSGAEKKMGTTMTFLKLHEKGAFIAHMGDSRVYQIRPGNTGDETRIVFQTEDHSLVNDLIKIGELTKEEARFSKQKNVITRAMQPNMGRRPKADVYETSDIKAGDYFYMCSDGMLEQAEMENGESLKNIFSEMGGSDENKVEILKSVTEKNRDNHTAIIIHILEVEDPIEVKTTEKTYSQVVDDKFTAIVEEETEKAESNSEKEEHELTRNQDTTEEGLLQSKKNDNIPIEKIESKPQSLLESSNKKLVAKNTLYSNMIKFLGAAIIVLLIIIGVNYFRSCSKDKDNIGKEEIELPDKPTPSSTPSRHNPPRKVNGTGPNETAASPSAQAAVDAANSTAANQLDATESSSQELTAGTNSIQLPPKKDPTEDVIESDQQLIQNIKNK